MSKRTQLNIAGSQHCVSLISEGKVNKNAIGLVALPEGSNSNGFLGKSDDGVFLYPVVKDGAVSRDALVYTRLKSAQLGDQEIFQVAGELIDQIDGTKNYTGKKALPMMMRSWSKIVMKEVDEDKRILTGVASTPSSDRMNDIVEPLGAEFELPLPFLWQHDSHSPAGEVTNAKPTKNGIPVTIQVAQIDEPGMLKDFLDYVWQSLKIGLVKGLSIGFAPIEYSFMDDGGIHFTKWAWLELSGVTIPANADCSITSIKAFDVEALRQRATRSKKYKDHVVVKLSRDYLKNQKPVDNHPLAQIKRAQIDQAKKLVVRDLIE